MPQVFLCSPSSLRPRVVIVQSWLCKMLLMLINYSSYILIDSKIININSNLNLKILYNLFLPSIFKKLNILKTFK